MQLTPEQITDVWNSMGGADNFLKGFGYVQFAWAIQAEVNKQRLAIAHALLAEAAHHLTEHALEYSHVHPRDLVPKIEQYLKDNNEGDDMKCIGFVMEHSNQSAHGFAWVSDSQLFDKSWRRIPAFVPRSETNVAEVGVPNSASAKVQVPITDEETQELIRTLMCAAENLRSADRPESTVEAGFRLAAKLDTFRHSLGSTPAAAWRVLGEPDPHSPHYYNRARATLTLGSLTDDELANAVFMHDHRSLNLQAIMRGEPSSVALLTAAKERIRWLSRALVKATDQASIPDVKPEGVKK